MNIRFRPGGINPSPYDIEKVYLDIREVDEITISSTLLLDRIRLGVRRGEIPYGVTKVSIYDDNGYKHESGITKEGKFENADIYYVHPIPILDDILDGLIDDCYIMKETCGNCKYNSDGLCSKDESLYYNTSVADFEEACEEFAWA